MKTKDVTSKYGLNQERFEYFLRRSSYKTQIKEGFLGGTMIDDRANIDAIVRDFKKYEDDLATKVARETQEKADEEARKKAEEEEQALPEGGQYVMTVDSNGRVSGYFTNDMMSMYYEISGNVDDLGAFNGTARCNPNPPLGGGQGFCIEQIATGKMKGKFTSPPNIRGSGSMTLGTICSGSWK